MDDLAHPQETAEAEVVADDRSAGNAAIEAENTDAIDFYAEDKPPEETPQEGEDDADEDDDAEGEPLEDIAAPVGLKAEDQAKFAKLPPEAQRLAAEILQSRNLDAQKGVEAALAAQRDAERTAADHVATAQRDFAQRYGALIQAFQPQPPPVELARDSPAEYLFLKAQYDEDAANFGQLVNQVSSLTGQADAHFQTRNQEWLQSQVKELSVIPEFANDSTRGDFLRGISEVGKELGYSEEQLHEADAKDFFALNKVRILKTKADKWDAHQKKRNERPRAAQGRFATAPAGNGARAPASGPTDTLKALYPND